MTEKEKGELTHFIKAALAEDVGDGDHTSRSTIPEGKKGVAQLIIKESGTVAGIEEALAVLNEVDKELEAEVFLSDGESVHAGDIVMCVTGRIHSILLAERLLLNIMQRMSGIATATRRIVNTLAGTRTQVLDTRKTTPLLRFLEKKAVRVGGGINHRFGLYDMILIKDNHVDYAGGIREAIEQANRYRKKMDKPIDIEIEVRNQGEVADVLNVGGIERIMLDNFRPEEIREAVALINGRFVTEASGGITEENVREYAEAGVDYISMGALTHSVKSLDMSLKAKTVSCDS
ncbi:carboxylating nicotinate-nucleotide diphosphorylase [Parapedobacter indicus]|uniref:Probable nicotinate-nucleotide pyrophosphorylase [carboxylating] n=1 Tax=Parapedobacter indicus TaxID=1477437 RepID=A0A1I3J4R4_9SPHI|nr:carboxylating nicotinate-nucleotide diphosphorylase [Parapedobacter indicus]PPL02387.1 nicotinate-nucleotide pyrophosphorylase [carboxylating] [Parapedobacter indicus]SFI54968.1 nicotinate-nucleotide pyrophosphorylase [carboxylating] [Parapedobacter indicus]